MTKANALIVADLKRIQSNPLSEGQLQVAKALLLGALATQSESYNGVAGALLSAARDDLPLDQEWREARGELTATPQQVQAAVAHWVRPEGFAQVIEGPAPR
ncbi:MAG: hypothetical protein JO293_07285 [Candidatus Eremiobacteraeota bacterium]|nr:hypothetical protein [Candidatus Eremiobacteraeota bacterium]